MMPAWPPTSWGSAFGLELAAFFATHLQVVAAASGVAYSFDLAVPPEHGRQLDVIVSVGLRRHSGS